MKTSTSVPTQELSLAITIFTNCNTTIRALKCSRFPASLVCHGVTARQHSQGKQGAGQSRQRGRRIICSVFLQALAGIIHSRSERITISPAPATLKKEAAGFALPIAVGMLAGLRGRYQNRLTSFQIPCLFEGANMGWYIYPAHLAAGIFLANGVPHFVNGISGNRFQTPFASPPGVGESSPLVNVIWGMVNFVIGWVLLFAVGNFTGGLNMDTSVFALGVFLCGVGLSWHFGRVRNR